MALTIERVIASVAPGWARRRAEDRIAFDMLARYFDAAKPSRATKNWATPQTSADAETLPALAALRARSRDLERNNAWARKAARMLPAHMIGTGVLPRPTSGADATRRRAMGVWESFCETSDAANNLGFYAQQHQAASAVVRDGEVFLRYGIERGVYTVSVLEGDYLDETYNESSRNGSGSIEAGIEYDASGRRVAYHFFREHPGNWSYARLPNNRERVRVRASDVDHIYEVVRPGQTRGLPWLAASALRMRDMDDYLVAERWRKKVAAAFAAFVTSPNPASSSPVGAYQRTETDDGGNRRGVEQIVPGTIKRLLPGEDIEFPSTPSDNGLGDYLRWELFAISAGIGVPYAELTGDLSNANYSSMRLGKIEFWTLLDAWQWHMLAPMMLRPAWRRVQNAFGVVGMGAEWSFPKRQWVDPEKDVEAEIKAIRAGLMSQPDAIAARGDDWRSVQREQAEFLASANSLGLVYDTDPSRTTRNGQSNAQAAPVTTDGEQPQQQ